MLRRVKKKSIEKKVFGEETTSRTRTEEASDEEVVFDGADNVIEKLQETTSASKRRKRRKLESTDLKPAWEDNDDSELQVKITAKDPRHADLKHLHGKSVTTAQLTSAISHQYEKTMGLQPEWAKLGKREKNDEDDSDSDAGEGGELLRSTGNYLTTSSDCLPAGVIQMQKCADINREKPVAGKLKCVEFHPNARVALAGGMDCTLSLFQVDGKQNPKIQSVFLERFPIYAAHFSQDGNEVVLGSRHKSLYTYDLMSGKITLTAVREMVREGGKSTKRLAMSPDGKLLVILGPGGQIQILSAKSKQWIGSMAMNSNVEAVTFNNDGSKMFSHGDDGDVYVWDMKTRSCVHRFTDDGCIQGTSLAVSNGNRYLAAGSHSGVVNIYDYETVLSAKQPRPLKAVMNLTTACTSLSFNSTSEILAMAGNGMEKAVKLLHVPSLTVFSNFPEFRDRLRIPLCLDFSLNSGYFTIGNNAGQALLYRSSVEPIFR